MNRYRFLLVTLLIFCINPVFSAQNITDKKPVKLKAESDVVNTALVLKDDYIKTKYASAGNRFLQGNVKASYDDFAELISQTAHDDYAFLSYGIKMSEYGFFDLVDKLEEKLDNNMYTENYLNDIKSFYAPSGMVRNDDIIYLADAYSAITYNNLAMETTSELLNNDKLSESDYKNYLIALGYYKSNNLHKALKYINNAITENEDNLNYKLLKIKILADSDKSKQACKVLKDVKKAELLTTEFKLKIRCIEEYVAYKTAKEEVLKDYHLAYYYHLQGRSPLAIKVLQGTILQAKQNSDDIFALLAKIYYDTNNVTKALEYAQRAYKEDRSNYLANITLANLKYDKCEYNDALTFYKKAKSLTKDIAPRIGIAKTYLSLDKDKKANKLYEKLLKRNMNSEELLISSMDAHPNKNMAYMTRIASLDISNIDIWLKLADYAIKDKNFSMAETYLNNSYYIDENDYRYYYYLSLLYAAKGENSKSNLALLKSVQLNSEAEKGVYEK